jgi:hypothetical protein
LKARLVSNLDAYEVKNWFQAFAFKCNLYRYSVDAYWAYHPTDDDLDTI